MQKSDFLQFGYILHSTKYSYKIIKVLGQGSFGITYLANVIMEGPLGTLDSNMNVAIKEFFMREVNGRIGETVTSGSKGGLSDYYKGKFRREALNLSKLHHSNIVKVLETFETNNTVYYVMEYIDGNSLNKAILLENGFNEDYAIRIMDQICEAVQFMHDNKMLHLDIKPSNIMLRGNGDAVLIDFGLSKQYNEEGIPESSTNIGGGTPGFAPIEQSNYREGKEFPVTMDVYALGGTLFNMLTGERPPEASEILNNGFPWGELKQHNISDKITKIVERAMEPIKRQRFQSVKELSEQLKASNVNNELGNYKQEKRIIKIKCPKCESMLPIKYFKGIEDKYVTCPVCKYRGIFPQFVINSSSEKCFFPKLIENGDYTISIEKIPIPNPLPMPNQIYIKYMPNDNKGIGYEIWIGDKKELSETNVFFVYKDGKKIGDCDFYLHIGDDVKKYIRENGFLTEENWEYENSTTPIDPKFGIDVEVKTTSIIEGTGSNYLKTVSHRVSQASYIYHHLLLGIVDGLLNVPSIKRDIEETIKEGNSKNIKNSKDGDSRNSINSQDCIRIVTISKELGFEYYSNGDLLIDDSGNSFMNEVAQGITYDKVNLSKGYFVSLKNLYSSLEDFIHNNIEDLRNNYNFITFRSLNDYIYCLQLMKKYSFGGRLTQEMQAMAMGINNRIDDKIVCLEYDANTCIIQYGGGVSEVLGDSYQTACVDSKDISEIIQLGEIDAISLLMVSIGRWYYNFMTKDFFQDEVVLDSIPFPVYLVVLDKYHRIYFCTTIIEKCTTIPCKKTEEVTLSDDCDLYLKVGGKDYLSILKEKDGDIVKDDGKLFLVHLKNKMNVIPRTSHVTISIDTLNNATISVRGTSEEDQEVIFKWFELI